jgi:hypothetical protein
MGKRKVTSSPKSNKRVTPSIRKRKRSEVVSIDQHQRRSKRLQKCNDSTTIPAVLLTPPSSILDSARSSSTRGLNGRRKYTGSKFDLADALSKGALFSPQQGQANATEKEDEEKGSNDDGPRHCYCNGYCQACTSTATCELHEGFFCSVCNDWFHATCTGWEIHGDAPNQYMESKMYSDLKLSLDSISQEDSHPWYCIRCWEKSFQTKHSYHGSIVRPSNRRFVLGLKSIVQFCLET